MAMAGNLGRTGSLVAAALLLALSGTALAERGDGEARRGLHHAHALHAAPGHAGRSFNRIATLPNYRNNGEPAVALPIETVSEIVAATQDGMTLAYTDGEREVIGFIDLRDPRDPRPAGTVAVPGEPTSVAILGNELAVAAIDTSASLLDTSGVLVVIDIVSRGIVREVALGGQPDSVAVSPGGRYLAVAIENERDEEICVGGAADGAPVPEDDEAAEAACEDGGGVIGGLPQTKFGNPPGFLAVVDTSDWSVTEVDLTGLPSAFAPEDPEPEFVDINADEQAVVTLQENNAIAVVDLASATVVSDFSLGTVSLDGVDAVEDDVISLTDTLVDLPREPDAVAWVPNACGGRPGIATANEGDLFGGSRGFSVFCPHGSVAFDSGSSFEEVAVRHGHYPERRSENKGSEPEAVEYGDYGRDGRFLFVGSERGSFVAVYRVDRRGRPRFAQLLPAPLGPEGVLAIPSRGLLVVSGEEDDPSFGVRSSVMIYALERGRADYPQIRSADGPHGKPIGWSALSGMVALPGRPDRLLAVWDSFYAESRIFHIDASREPAVIDGAITITGGSGDLDPEGIAIAPDGTLWIASEGDDPGARRNLLVQLDRQGRVIREVGLPQSIEDCRAASTATANLDNGFEGVAVVRGPRGYRLLAAQQLPWDYTTPECEALDDEPGFTRLWVYDPRRDAWSSIAYELAPKPANASWVGLSEVTALRGGGLLLIERDNRSGDFAELKTLVRVGRHALRDGRITAGEKRVFDLVPELLASNGWISDKPEGVAVTRQGRVFLVTDNDGVDDWSGETWFLDLGPVNRLFFGRRAADREPRHIDLPGRGRGRDEDG